LSDEFLAEVRDAPKKNLAIEALKKLINGDVRSQAKSNVRNALGGGFLMIASLSNGPRVFSSPDADGGPREARWRPFGPWLASSYRPTPKRLATNVFEGAVIVLAGKGAPIDGVRERARCRPSDGPPDRLRRRTTILLPLLARGP
jgi:hypothetical protein